VASRAGARRPGGRRGSTCGATDDPAAGSPSVDDRVADDSAIGDPVTGDLAHGRSVPGGRANVTVNPSAVRVSAAAP
jgi:hypothetical protein